MLFFPFVSSLALLFENCSHFQGYHTSLPFIYAICAKKEICILTFLKLVVVCVCFFLTPWPFHPYTPFSALTKKLWNLREKEWFYALQSSSFTIFTFRTCLFACIYPFSYSCFKRTHCFLKGLKVMNYFFLAFCNTCKSPPICENRVHSNA